MYGRSTTAPQVSTYNRSLDLRGNEQGAKGTPTGYARRTHHGVVVYIAWSRAHGRPLGMTGCTSPCTSEDVTDHGTLCNLLQEGTQDHRVCGMPLHLVV